MLRALHIAIVPALLMGADRPKPIEEHNLTMPVKIATLKELNDTFYQGRGANRHEAIDILQPRGTPVVAVEDGEIRKLFLSKPGGKTIYLFEPTEEYCYYYAHLDGYAPGLKEGQHVTRGQVIGYVGTTGNAPPNTPHLHFTIFKLGTEKKWYKADAIDPYPYLVASAKRAGIK